MVRIRTVDEIVLSILDYYKNAQPNLDLKPGTVARDLLVDGPAVQIAKLYEELLRVQDAQSLFLSLGQDLEALGANFGGSKKQGSKASGIALLTFNDIEADIPIDRGGLVIASSGASFSILNSTTVSVINKNTYRAIASKNRAALDFVGINDEYAIEVGVEASTTGNSGNISRYSLVSATISGISGVTNAMAFSGGSSAESDSAFKRRLLGIFSGSNTGTTIGYRDTIMSDPDIIDAIVVSPGDPLMTRDGTQVFIAENGTRTITSEGTGGKVDIYVYGFRLLEVLDSFIYFDHSNRNNPADISNDFVLGQIEGDQNKTISKRRLENIENQELPNQPVVNILDVTGSSSGTFEPISIDSFGRVSGNYMLVPDDGAYAGSPWSFDRLRWIDDRIRDYPEDITKGKFNSQDASGFSDVLKINSIQQNIQILNENSQVLPSDRSSIQLSHYPITAVSRVFNQTTGERYVVSNQKPDGGDINTTGRIIISGSTLPAISDTLQVDYIWLFNYDPSWDFDNRVTSNNIRNVVDSIDWGYSNNVRREEVVVTDTISVTHPINAVVSVNTFTEQLNAVVIPISSRLAVTVNSLVANVISVTDSVSGAELFKTGRDDGSFNGLTIYLPTNTTAIANSSVNVKYNAVDYFNQNGISGSFSGNEITLPAGTVISGIVEVNYLADIRQLIPATAISVIRANGITRIGNEFSTDGGITSFGVQPTTHLYSDIPSVNFDPIILRNLRQAPSRLKLTIAGTISPGVLTVLGTSVHGVFEGVFRATEHGLTQDLSSLIRKSLGLNSNQSIPSNIEVIRLVSFEKVQVANNNEVLSVLQNYDVFGYSIKNNDFIKYESVKDTSLTSSKIKLPNTITNNNNLPRMGDVFRVTFYIANTNNIENIAFSKSGSLYTQGIFAFVKTISVSSGFTSGASQTATLTVMPQNQPVQGSRYTSYYDYLAPKPNERITIRYNKNQVISDGTLEIERTRIIGSDVLVKAAQPILIDITLAIVVNKGFEKSSIVVAQNIKDAIVNALNASALGTTIDESDFITVAYTINGVDRVRSLHFNEFGKTGRVLSITAGKNQFIQANNVVIQVETR